MRILVTGASGLLGLNLVLEAAGKHTVFGQVNSNPLQIQAFQRKRSAEASIRMVQTDLLAPNAVQRLLEQTQPEWVIHCAALANLDACEADPQQARQLNTEIPKILAEHVARGGARLLHVSTDAVFDGQTAAEGGYEESDPPNPTSIYAQTKLDAERAVAAANAQAIIARVNLFGWSLSGRRSLAEFFFNNLSAGKPVMGFTDVIFCPLLANHLAHIFIEMLEHGLSGLYHTVSSESTSKYEFGLQIAQRFGLDGSLITPTSWQAAGLKAARSPNLKLRSDKLAQALDQPLPTISTGLDEFARLYYQGYPQRLTQMRSR
jgi:dTDP-4-dehydrorhamnose reductase